VKLGNSATEWLTANDSEGDDLSDKVRSFFAGNKDIYIFEARFQSGLKIETVTGLI